MGAVVKIQELSKLGFPPDGSGVANGARGGVVTRPTNVAWWRIPGWSGSSRKIGSVALSRVALAKLWKPAGAFQTS
jgi:hypothetical protein